MQKIFILIILFICLLIPSTSWAEDITTGNYLLKACQEAIKESHDSYAAFADTGYVLGLVSGIRNTIDIYNNNLSKKDVFSCNLDKEITNGQLVRIVLKYLEDHPEQLHKNGAALAIGAIIIACQKQNK